MYTKDRLVGLLPYYLQDGENIKKYYETLAKFYDEIIDIFKEITDSRDIDLAEMYGLDILGDIVNQPRTSKYKDDEKYRNRLKTKVMQNNSMADIESINSIANSFLEDNFIGIKQGYQDNKSKEPAMLEVNLSANKLESVTLDNTIQTLKCGVELGTTTLGLGLGAIPKVNQIKKYKPIFIPNLQNAIGIGVRLQYRMINNKEVIKIKHKPKLNFKSKSDKIDIVSKPSKMNLKCKKDTIKIQLKPFCFKQNYIKCGNTSLPAKMGVLL